MDGLETYRLVRRRTDWAVAKGDRVVTSYVGQAAAEAALHALALIEAAARPAEPRSFAALDERSS